MSIKSITAAAAVALSMAVPANAVPVEIDFFVQSKNYVGGTLFGLDNEIAGQQQVTMVEWNAGASTFDITATNPPTSLGFVEFDPTGTFVLNAEVEHGAVVSQFGTQLDWLLRIIGSRNNNSFVLNNGNFTTYGSSGTTIREAVSAVPLPAGAVLLLSGLGGLAVAKRRKSLATERQTVS